MSKYVVGGFLTLILTASVFLFFCSLLPLSVNAAETGSDGQKFTPLVDIPGITDAEADIGDYVNGLYWLSITAASLLVVVRIIGAGAGYVMTDVVTTKVQAKKDIQNALIGLLIILAAVTILTEINPNLKRLNFLEGVKGIQTSGSNVLKYSDNKMWIAVCKKPNCEDQIQVCQGSNGFQNYKIDGDRLTCNRDLTKKKDG